jgi:succinate-semialdehyde dehydrogenase/glutarate-semialdehyde dehydrogenase
MQCIRFLAASVMAGNSALIRHSHNTTRCALYVEEIFKEAGFPEGTVQILLVSKEQVSKVIDDRRIKGVTITGNILHVNC